MNKIFYFFIPFLLIFTGCSSKQYYEPEKTHSFKQDRLELHSSIIDLNADGATLDNSSFISKKGILSNIKENYKFLNFSDDTILASDTNMTIYIKNKTIDKTLTFDKNIISASFKDNLLAFGSVDNSITLYDIKKDKTLFKNYLKASTINNIKIANPIFLENIVLYPTLDGKVVILSLEKNTIIKTINIDPSNDINNVIFLKEIGDSLIVATTNKLFSFVDGQSNIKEVDIQNIIVHKKFIYVATLDGQIIKYDINLKKLASKKFKFAKINALAFGSYLYALESQDFLIRISEDFKNVKIFNFSFDEEEKVIGIQNKIYFDDEYIILK